MALVKRNKMWSTDFSVNGQRYRQSLHTSDWREAQQREKALIANATIGRLTPSGQQFVRLAFSEAAARYLQSRTLELSERSLKKERQLLVQPSRHFGSTPVAKITTDMLIAYRESRSITGVANAYLNMETGAIRRILKRAKRWHLIADDFAPLEAAAEDHCNAFRDVARYWTLASRKEHVDGGHVSRELVLGAFLPLSIRDPMHRPE